MDDDRSHPRSTMSAEELHVTDLDNLNRAELRGTEFGNMPGDFADILDEWLHEEHGVTSSHHGVGSFLYRLAAAGYMIIPIKEQPER